jgi:hypothetical protein
LTFVKQDWQHSHLLVSLSHKYLKITLNMFLQLRVIFILITPKYLPLLNLIIKVPIKGLKVISQLQIHISLQPGKILVLLDPQITMLRQFILIFDVFGCLFYRLKLKNIASNIPFARTFMSSRFII